VVFSAWLSHRDVLSFGGEIGLKEKLHEAQHRSRMRASLMALAVWTEPALARSYLNCLTKKVVIVDAPRGSTSSSIEENLASGSMKRQKPSCLPMVRRTRNKILAFFAPRTRTRISGWRRASFSEI
jgi:hypothetical protein